MRNQYEPEKVISIVRDSTEQVFSMMLSLPCVPGEPYSERAEAESFDGVISVVGLAGAWVGSGRISCTAECACRLSGALLCAEYSAVDEEVLDAMAELTNMIIGNVKSALEDDLGPMGLSVPTVIFGRNYRARSSGVSEWLVFPFQVEEERMEIRFFLVPSAATVVSRSEPVLHTVS